MQQPMLSNHKPLILGTTGDYPPFTSSLNTLSPHDHKSPKNEFSPEGFDIDLLTFFLKEQGLTARWTQAQWPTLSEDLSSLKTDAIVSGITYMPERDILGIFSQPYLFNATTVLSAADKHTDLSSPRLRIGVNRGGYLQKRAPHLFPEGSIIPISDNRNLVEGLKKNIYDAILTDAIEAHHLKKQHSLIKHPSYEEQKMCVLFSKKNTELVKIFNDWLRAFVPSQNFTSLLSKWEIDEELRPK